MQRVSRKRGQRGRHFSLNFPLATAYAGVCVQAVNLSGQMGYPDPLVGPGGECSGTWYAMGTLAASAHVFLVQWNTGCQSYILVARGDGA